MVGHARSPRAQRFFLPIVAFLSFQSFSKERTRCFRKERTFPDQRTPLLCSARQCWPTKAKIQKPSLPVSKRRWLHSAMSLRPTGGRPDAMPHRTGPRHLTALMPARGVARGLVAQRFTAPAVPGRASKPGSTSERQWDPNIGVIVLQGRVVDHDDAVSSGRVASSISYLPHHDLKVKRS